MQPWSFPDPQGFLQKVQDEVSRTVERLWHTGVSTRPLDGQEWAPPIDVSEGPDSYTVTMEVAGVNANEIDITLSGRQITVRGVKESPVGETGARAIKTERRFGGFCRFYDFPAEIQPEGMSARCHGGVLTILIPKSASSRHRSVKVVVED